MAVNELDLTVVGWVGSDPRYYAGDLGQVPYTQLRLASTPRVFDREQGTYVDGGTEWFTVKVFRAMAQNVAESVRRGDPLVVRGRLHLEEWDAPDGQVRTSAVLVASAIGHNMAYGTTRLVRTVRSGPGDGGEAAGGRPRLAAPVDLSGTVEVDEDGRLLGAPAPDVRDDPGEQVAVAAAG